MAQRLNDEDIIIGEEEAGNWYSSRNNSMSVSTIEILKPDPLTVILTREVNETMKYYWNIVTIICVQYWPDDPDDGKPIVILDNLILDLDLEYNSGYSVWFAHVWFTTHVVWNSQELPSHMHGCHTCHLTHTSHMSCTSHLVSYGLHMDYSCISCHTGVTTCIHTTRLSFSHVCSRYVHHVYICSHVGTIVLRLRWFLWNFMIYYTTFALRLSLPTSDLSVEVLMRSLIHSHEPSLTYHVTFTFIIYDNFDLLIHLFVAIHDTLILDRLCCDDHIFDYSLMFVPGEPIEGGNWNSASEKLWNDIQSGLRRNNLAYLWRGTDNRRDIRRVTEYDRRAWPARKADIDITVSGIGGTLTVDDRREEQPG